MADYKYYHLPDGKRIVLELGEREGKPAWVRSDLTEIPEEIGSFPEPKPGEIDASAAIEQRSRTRNQVEAERAKEEFEYYSAEDARRAPAKDLGWRAPVIATGAAADRMVKGLGDIANFGYDILGGEHLKNLGIVDQSPIELQVSRDKDYDETKQLMQGFYEEQPAATLFGEIPVFMATSAALTPAGRTAVGATLSGVARGAEATTTAGRGLFSRSIDALRTQPGRVGKIGERIYQESVLPRQLAARASSRRVSTIDPAVKGVLKETLSHGAVGGVEGLIDPEMTTAGGAMASLLGSASGQIAKKGLHRTPIYWRDKEKELIDWYEKEGGQLLPGMQTGSRRIQKFEGALEQQERFSDLFNLIKQDNQIVTNRIAWEAAGIPYHSADDISGKVLKTHMEGLRKEYDDIAAQSRGVILPAEMNAIGTQIGQLKKMKSDDAKKALKAAQGYMSEMRDRVKPKVSSTGQKTGFVYNGKDLQSLRSRLKSEIDAAYQNNNRIMTQALKPMLDSLDASLERGVDNIGRSTGNPGLVTKWKDLNERYAMSKLLLNHGTDVATGDFNASKFMSYLQSSDPERAIMESGNRIVPLFKLAKVNELMKRQAKPGLSGSDDLPQTKAGNTASMSLPQKMFTLGKSVGYVPLLDRAAMSLYKRGYPTGTGLLGWTGDQVYRNVPDYTRASAQSSQFYPWLEGQIESGANMGIEAKNRVQQWLEDRDSLIK